MNVADLPLPLRLRNALLKAGFKTDADLRAWVLEAETKHDFALPGIGATGVQQLLAWAAGEADPLRGPAKPTAASNEAPIEEATPEEAVARSTVKSQRHEVSQMVDTAMRGGLDGLDGLEAQLRRGEELVESHRKVRAEQVVSDLENQWSSYKVELAQRSAQITTMSGPAARNTLILQLETDIQARIGALIPTIKALPHVKELGVDVSAETVGRMALIRGLDALERAHKVAPKSENPAPTPENREDQTPIPPPDDAEELSTPEGWTKVGPTDKIPVPEAVLHDYYTQNGWNRYWGMVDGTPIYFYWSPRRSLQELDVFPGTDKSGRKVAVQETPWGPGHVVPTKWSNS
jgi:hypothetical protein